MALICPKICIQAKMEEYARHAQIKFKDANHAHIKAKSNACNVKVISLISVYSLTLRKQVKGVFYALK